MTCLRPLTSSLPPKPNATRQLLRVEALLAHSVAAIPAVVAEIAVAGAARHQVVTIVALVAQVAIRAVAHRQLSHSPNADASATARSRNEERAEAIKGRLHPVLELLHVPQRHHLTWERVRFDLAPAHLQAA
jgi:hypothetical protein